MTQPSSFTHDVYLDPAGQEYVARGGVPYYWNYSLRVKGQPIPPNHLLVGQATIRDADREEAAVGAVTHLRAGKQRILADAAVDAAAVDERINKMLAIPFTPAKEQSNES